MHRSALPLYGSIATTGLSTAAAGLVGIAIPWSLIAGGAGATPAGLAAFAVQLPVALGMLAGGALVDRFGAWRVLTLSNGAAVLLLAAAALAVGALPFAATVALLALANLLATPGTVAQDARVPELARLAGTSLERANGLRDIVGHLGTVGGPAAGVLLVEAVGLAGALAVAAALSLAILVADAALFPRFRPRRRRQSGAGRPSALGRVLGADRTLTAVAAIGVCLVAVFTALDEILVPALLVAAGLDGGAMARFLLLAGGCAMASSAGYALAGDRLPARPLFLAGVAGMAAGLGVMALAPVDVALWLAPALIGLGVGPLWPLILTGIHRRIPVEERGRVIGALAGVLLLAQPLATLAAGPAVDALGGPAVIQSVSLAVALVALVAMLSPALRGLDRRV